MQVEDDEGKLLEEIATLKKIIEDINSMEADVSVIVHGNPGVHIDCFTEARYKIYQVLKNQRDQLCVWRSE